METLQGLAQVLTILDERASVPVMESPFAAMGAAGKPVAAAFAVAFDIGEVWAALRFHRRMTGQDMTGYLIGSHLRYWQDRDYEIGELPFLDLRERAAEWLAAQS